MLTCLWKKHFCCRIVCKKHVVLFSQILHNAGKFWKAFYGIKSIFILFCKNLVFHNLRFITSSPINILPQLFSINMITMHSHLTLYGKLASSWVGDNPVQTTKSTPWSEMVLISLKVKRYNSFFTSNQGRLYNHNNLFCRGRVWSIWCRTFYKTNRTNKEKNLEWRRGMRQRKN